MSSFSFKAIAASTLVALVALAGCGGSNSSDIRTRNSSEVGTCISVLPSLTEPKIDASIRDVNCAASIVDVSQSSYYVYGSEESYSSVPTADRGTSTATSTSYVHSNIAYSREYEVRNANGIPVEYVKASGDGQDNSSLVLRPARILPSTVEQSCIKPRVNENGASFDMWDCTDNDMFTMYYPFGDAASPTHTNLKSYVGRTFGVFSDAPTTESRDFYASATAYKDGFPQTKVTLTISSELTFVFRFYTYSEGEESTPFESDDSSTTSSSVVETSSSSSIDPTETTNSIEESSTSSTTPETSSTMPTVISEQSIADAKDACSSLDGIEVSPGFDAWTDRTKFEISIDNDCMSSIGNLSMGISHQLIAENKENGHKKVFNPSGNQFARTVFSGRLYAGDWKLTIRQSVYLPNPEGSQEEIKKAKVVNVNVKTESDTPWTPCTSSDIEIVTSQISLNCEYSNANMLYQFTNSTYESIPLVKGSPQSITNAASGWQPAIIEVDLDGYIDQLPMLFCVSKCTVLPNELKAEATRTGNLVTLTTKETACSVKAVPYVGVYFLQQINDSLMVHKPRIIGSYLDAMTTENATITLSISKTVNTLLVFNDVDPLNEECENVGQLPGSLFSVLRISENTSTQTTPEETAVVIPARVTEIEFSRTDSTGTNVIVEEGATVLEIPAFVLPAAVTDSNSSVVSVSVRTGSNKWTPISKNLSTFVPVDDNTEAVEVKYTFADGSEAVVTKPIESTKEFDELAADSSSSGIPLIPIAIVIGLIVLAGVGITARRRAQ